MFAHSRFYFLYQATLLLPLLPNLSVAEWVDMPQFSDETKIYRIPAVHDQFYKFRRGDVDNFHVDGQRNGSQSYRRPVVQDTHTTDDVAERIKMLSPVPETTTATSYLIPEPVTDEYTETSENRDPTGVAIANENQSADGSPSDRHGATSPTKSTILDTLTTAQTPSSSTAGHEEEINVRDEYYNNTLKQDDGLLQYLPMDILKNVHRTLSQPVTLEGKIHFLKTFEETLMSEIESRLVTTMTPRRRARGADYHGHGYDYHDDHSVGFPSIEGALMAISFLTFAVYLVRLVMLLFRNMNPPVMTTTTAATIFLGKRKRSVDFDDDTARILSNMNGFVSNF